MSKYFIKEAQRVEAAQAAAGLFQLEMRRRRFLKWGLGAGVGLAGAATLAAQCGGGAAPTATTAPAAATAAPAATEVATAAVAATAVPTMAGAETPAAAGTSAAGEGVIVIPGVPSIVVKDTGPYGYSGQADRAIAGAKAIAKKGTIGVVYASGSRPNWEPYLKEWQDQTGFGINLIEVPVGEAVTKFMQGTVSKDQSWDLIVTNPREMGDLEGAQANVDWTAYAKKYDLQVTGKPWGFIGDAASKFQTYYRGKVLAITADGDIFNHVYRKDLYEDPTEQSGFKAKYGYDMIMDTWEHYRDVCEWFTRPDKNMYGSDNIRSKGWGYWWWEMHYASQALPCAYYFDDNMSAAIDSPEGINATKQYISFKSTSHPDVLNWDWAQEYASFTGGAQFSIISWPSLDKYAIDPTTSKLKPEQLAFGLVPGTMVGGKLNRRSIYSYGNAVMGWSHGQVDQEAVYCLAQWFTSNEMSAKSLTQLGFLDPYRWTDCNAATVQKAYGAPYLGVHAENYKITAPDIFMQGSAEYCQNLDDNLQLAWNGASTPEDCMKTVAAAWNEITDRIGRDSLKEVWTTLKTYYPEVDTSGTTGKNFMTLPG